MVLPGEQGCAYPILLVYVAEAEEEVWVDGVIWPFFRAITLQNGITSGGQVNDRSSIIPTFVVSVYHVLHSRATASGALSGTLLVWYHFWYHFWSKVHRAANLPQVLE